MTDRQAAEARERERTEELERAGAAVQQARWMARQERLDDAEVENERLWDQADEIAALKSDRDALSVRLAQAEQELSEANETNLHLRAEFERQCDLTERTEVRLRVTDALKREYEKALTWISDASYIGNYAPLEVIEIYRKWARAALAASGGREAPDTKEPNDE